MQVYFLWASSCSLGRVSLARARTRRVAEKRRFRRAHHAANHAAHHATHSRQHTTTVSHMITAHVSQSRSTLLKPRRVHRTHAQIHNGPLSTPSGAHTHQRPPEHTKAKRSLQSLASSPSLMLYAFQKHLPPSARHASHSACCPPVYCSASDGRAASSSAARSCHTPLACGLVPQEATKLR